jgi:small-conductance mechanosensitive channel
MTQLEHYQAIVEQFRANEIEIPFPQRDLHVLDSTRIEVKSA